MKIIEDETFLSLQKLRVLIIVDNLISYVTAKTFSGLVNLQKLVLINNRIRPFSVDVFRDFPRLFHLVLAGPKLDVLSLICDGRLCWLKEEEKKKTITWQFRPKGVELLINPKYYPKCYNRVNWMD